MNIVPDSSGRFLPFPLTTMACSSIDSSVWLPTGHEVSQAIFRPLTLLVLICFASEKRVFAMSAPPCGKSASAGPRYPDTPAGSQEYGFSADALR